VEYHPSAHDPGVTVVVPAGRLDALAAPDLERTLADLEAQGSMQILLSFHQSSYISSSSLRVMLIHARRLRQSGGSLKLCCVPDKVIKVLHTVGFDTVFKVFPSEQLAVQSFSSSVQNPPVHRL
jgi:anti-anti-sigma factor